MSNNQNVRRAGILYLVGNLFNKGIAFLTVPIFTRILSTYDYGIVTTYNSWTAILNMILGCALTMGVRAAFIDYEDETKEFTATVVRFTFCVTVAATVLAVAASSLFKVTNTTLIIVVFCFLQGGFGAIIDDYIQYLMMKYKYIERTALMILPNLLASLISIAVIMIALKSELYLGRIIPTALVYVLFGLFSVLCFAKVRVSFLSQKKYIKYALAVSMPLIVHGIALNVLSQSDRTMITWLADASQTGIYSLIYNFGMLATVITTALDGLWVPFFISKLKSKDTNEINDKAKWYITLMTVSMICLILLGPEIVKVLSSEAYWDGIAIIPPIVLANYLIFSYTLYVNIEHFHKKTKNITLYTVIAAVSNILANYLLIPHFGYVAAAYTTLFSYVIALFLHARKAKMLEPNLFPLSTFLMPFLHIVIAVLIFYAFIDCAFIRWILVVVYFAYTVFKNFNILKFILAEKNRP